MFSTTSRSHSILQLRPADWEDYVEVLIDGELLSTRLVESQQRLKSDYVYNDTGLGWGYVDSQSTAFDKQLREPGVYSGRVITVCNGCNILGCGDIWVDVMVDEEKLVYLLCRTPRMALDVPAIAFDKRQYFEEVEKMRSMFAR